MSSFSRTPKRPHRLLGGFTEQKYPEQAQDAITKDTEDHEYYNITIPNTTTTPIEARFTESRNAPLLDNPSLFHMSVIRFSIPAMLIPIFNFKNNTYKMRVTFGGVNYDDFVSYQDIYSLNDPHNQPVFSYQQFIDCINESILNCVVQAINLGHLTNTASIPWFGFNSSTGIITLYTKQEWDLQFGATLHTQLWMNDALYAFFDNFPSVRQPNTGWNNFYIQNTGNNFFPNANVCTPSDNTFTSYQPLTFPQEFNSLYLWNAVRRIVFTSGSVSVKGEYIPTNPTQGSSNTSQQILTDFEPSFSTGTEGRSFYQYVPTVLRFLDLTSTTPMTTFDMQAYWSDTSGTLYPVMIPPNEVLTCKVQFTRKSQTVN